MDQSEMFHTYNETTMLTQEDIEFIQLLIDQRIATFKQPAVKPQQDKNYHTVYEIRDIIMMMLPEFKQWINKESFQVTLLRHFLAIHVNQKPGDFEIILNGKNKGQSQLTRFNQQIANAIQTWRHGPFIKTDTPGTYLFR